MLSFGVRTLKIEYHVVRLRLGFGSPKSWEEFKEIENEHFWTAQQFET